MEEKNIKKVSSTTQKRGQSLVEYTLILALLGIAMGLAIAATGPAVGNVFSNVVFNLLRQTPEGSGPDIPGPVDFWLTVTYIAQNPQLEEALPTRTPAPPTLTPTAGPSPTPTPTVPTNTPLPSPTPPPTPTPPDITVVAPFLDESDPYGNTIDDPEHWRLGGDIFMGYDPWFAEFYPNTDLTGAVVSGPITQFNAPNGQILDFNWNNGSPISGWPSNDPGNDYSARFTREIFIDETITVNFSSSADDGVRVWIDYSPGCAAAGGVSNPPEPGDDNTGNNRSFGDPATHCLIIDDWQPQGLGNSPSASRTLTGKYFINSSGVREETGESGIYTITVEMYEGSGGSGISLLMGGTGGNPDNTTINNSGVATGGSPDCNWGRAEDRNNSASSDYMWEEYLNADFAYNARCYLEFRGYVLIPDESVVPELEFPQMVFWDVWDMDSGNQRGWVEVAEYIETAPNSGRANRAAMTWVPINLRQGDTLNYNWTRNVIDIENYITFSDPLNRRFTFRFVMENRNNGGTRRWYIDDVEINGRNLAGLDGNPAFTIGDTIDFETAEDVNRVITSARWDRTAGGADGTSNKMELSQGTNYVDHNQSPWSTTYNLTWVRIHYLELAGWVDISGVLPDNEGDSGNPMLSAYISHILGEYTGLEVQYTTDPYGLGASNWQAVPGIDPADPYGRIREITNNGNVNQGLMKYEIPLNEIPATRFRLRIALLVHNRASLRDGISVDEIYIEREGRPRYLNYPLYDNAETGVGNWLTGNLWWRTNEQAFDGTHSFTDTPNGNYSSNSDSSLRTIYPIDLFNDTPDNLALDDRNTAGGNGNPNAPGTLAPRAVDPVLIFYHTRELQRYDDLHVEWRRWNESDGDWKPLWSWEIGMNTLRSDNSWEPQTQLAWERVMVDLRPIMSQFVFGDADTEDDDILVRFRLYTDNNYEDNGVHIDGISLAERETPQSFRLWGPTDNRSVGGTNFGTGNGGRYADDFDSASYWQNWFTGGNWEIIEWETRNGLRAAHDSTGNGLQIAAPDIPSPVRYDVISDLWTLVPISVVDINSVPPQDIPLTYSQHDTFNVLEMRTIIDLRAVEVGELPTLYFWTRYHLGNDDRFSVEISYELGGSQAAILSQMNSWCQGNRPNCYEHEYGWSEWDEVWYRDEWDENWAWNREQISLGNYAATGIGGGDTPGKRIRIRFVYDALRHSDNRDGAYVDDIVIGPLQNGIIESISLGGFSDDASNLGNWITEGNWGLSPELFRDENGGPATLGVWSETWWNCRGCDNTSYISSSPSSTRFARGADKFLDSNGTLTPGYGGVDYNPVSRTVLDIQYDMRRNSPRPTIASLRSDELVGRWTLITPVVGTGGVDAGDYTFITQSDDGVRMKYEVIDAAGNFVSNPEPPEEWNILNNWTDHGRTADMGVAILQAGLRYRITLEYYERNSDATIILSVGGSAFSFTDSPKQGAGPGFLDMPSIPEASSSLILDGTLDLSSTVGPILEYWTYYEIDGYARVEVSVDGGFTWTDNGLRDNLTEAGGNVVTFDNPTFNGRHVPNTGGDFEWQQRQQNLTRYRGLQVMIRFRLDRLNRSGCHSNDNTCNENSTSYNDNGFFVGWWVVDIRVAETQ